MTTSFGRVFQIFDVLSSNDSFIRTLGVCRRPIGLHSAAPVYLMLIRFVQQLVCIHVQAFNIIFFGFPSHFFIIFSLFLNCPLDRVLPVLMF